MLDKDTPWLWVGIPGREFACRQSPQTADNLDMSYPAPRVSILIPNYNNGKASSSDGQTDLIADLLQSLHDTLHDDPTPLEIIAYDDGSTDDSLETLRLWSKKTWRDGQPFLKLIEAEHCGILSVGANRLVRESSGEFLARLDGDTQMLTRHWATLLCQTFDQGPPRLGMVGPKQLRPDGRIHAYGDWLLHPKGYHHILAGAKRETATHAMEVDHVMGCFYCCKREVYDEVGGYDENILRGQTIDFGLTARLKGWQCFAVPHIEYVHRHGQRKARATTADTQQGVEKTLDVFQNKWGFDRIAPDLDVVREKYTATPLLWNAEVFGTPLPCVQPEGLDVPAMDIQQSEWTRYGTDGAFKTRTDLNVAVALQVISQVNEPGKIAIVGSGAGLTTHLIAGQGHACIGTDPDPAKVKLANQCVAGQSYAADRPEFYFQNDPNSLPLSDGQAGMLFLIDQIEKHHNPVGLLREAHRALRNDGVLVVVTPKLNQTGLDTPTHRCYHAHELLAQMGAIKGWQPLNDPRQGEAKLPLVAVFKRIEKPKPASKKQTKEPAHAA